MKVVHIITGLNVGGAEMMLYKLLAEMDKAQFSSEVISMTDIGPVGKKIAALGISVRALGMRRGIPSPWGLFKLIKCLRQAKPDVIQSWIYQADLISAIAAKLAGNIPLVWGIRSSNLDASVNKRSVILIAKICAWISFWLPTKILCCSNASLTVHKALGYDDKKMLVLTNGFNVEQLKPSDVAGRTLRTELGLDSSALLVGMAGRFDPQKDHFNFIQAASIVASQNDRVYFILCGDGIDEHNNPLNAWISGAGLAGRLHLLGLRNDMPELMAALDIYASSSCGEGFPNVVGEAMACETPCVVTDVGDCALMVGDTGVVVPPSDAEALAQALLEMLATTGQQRNEWGRRARQRIVDKFSIAKIADQYGTLYQALR